MPLITKGVKYLYRIKYRGINPTQETAKTNGIEKGFFLGISKMWGETLDVHLFINESSLDSDGVISMHLCDSKFS